MDIMDTEYRCLHNYSSSAILRAVYKHDGNPQYWTVSVGCARLPGDNYSSRDIVTITNNDLHIDAKFANSSRVAKIIDRLPKVANIITLDDQKICWEPIMDLFKSDIQQFVAWLDYFRIKAMIDGQEAKLSQIRDILGV